ncbi:MAG TPA: HAD-IA family hydrolase [Candidatus Acidoferrum sp.]|nr:HAD-IA family hydrolase [Candidatus Acidoferrum sp.]
MTSQPSSLAPSATSYSQVRVLIFDLDGTLIDSKLDLALAVNATLVHMGRPELPHETVYGFVGNGASVLVRRSLGEGATDTECDEALAYFLSYYRAHMLDNTRPYPGVAEGLTLLSQRPMAVLTNKPVNFSRAILDGLGLSKFFRFVYGGNSFEKKKPDPYGVEVILRDLTAAPSEAMMVGDSDVDVKTARNAGILATGVSYGIGFHTFAAHPPDLLISSLTELPAYLNGHRS